MNYVSTRGLLLKLSERPAAKSYWTKVLFYDIDTTGSKLLFTFSLSPRIGFVN